MGSVGNSANTSESWRNTDPKYQEKTLGGIYFYDAPPVVSKVGNMEFYTDQTAIEKKWYDKLPNYAKESVLELYSTGESVTAFFKIEDGIVHMNHANEDFIWAVRQYRKRGKYVNANGYKGDPEKATDDYST